MNIADAGDALRREVLAIAHDDVSGATELTVRAADLLLRALSDGQETWVAQALLTAKPMMASLLNLACLVQGSPCEDALRIRAFRDGLVRATAEAAGRATAVLAQRGKGPWPVLTLSASQAVEETIRTLADRGDVASLIVAESRPRLEGVALARRLANLVPRIAVTHDAALPGLCTPQSLVLLGADAVLPDLFVNKAGSLALCLAARDAGATRLVVTSSHKVLLPEAAPFFRLPTSEDATREREDGTVFLDLQFERVPLSLVEAVVTERGADRSAG